MRDTFEIDELGAVLLRSKTSRQTVNYGLAQDGHPLLDEWLVVRRIYANKRGLKWEAVQSETTYSQAEDAARRIARRSPSVMRYGVMHEGIVTLYPEMPIDSEEL